jgi:hypothetical protein
MTRIRKLALLKSPGTHVRPHVSDVVPRVYVASVVPRVRVDLAVVQVVPPSHEKIVSTLRGQMEDATYQKLWNEGRAITLEQAIDLALGSK